MGETWDAGWSSLGSTLMRNWISTNHKVRDTNANKVEGYTMR